MNNTHNYKEEELDKAVTLGILLEYTDDFLIPRMSDMMGEKIRTSNDLMDDKIKTANALLENNLKSYIDDKLADYTSDIFKRLDKKYEKERQFKTKVVEILKKNNLGSDEEIAYLQGLVEGA